MLCAMHQRESSPWAESGRVNHVDPVWHGTSETLCPGRRGGNPLFSPVHRQASPHLFLSALVSRSLLGSLPGMGHSQPARPP